MWGVIHTFAGIVNVIVRERIKELCRLINSRNTMVL